MQGGSERRSACWVALQVGAKDDIFNTLREANATACSPWVPVKKVVGRCTSWVVSRIVLNLL